MKKILAVLLILIPLAAMSQEKKSDAFYYKGFELVNAKKYKEAIAHYEKCSLMDKALLLNSSWKYRCSTMLSSSV